MNSIYDTKIQKYFYIQFISFKIRKRENKAVYRLWRYLKLLILSLNSAPQREMAFSLRSLCSWWCFSSLTSAWGLKLSYHAYSWPRTILKCLRCFVSLLQKCPRHPPSLSPYRDVSSHGFFYYPLGGKHGLCWSTVIPRLRILHHWAQRSGLGLSAPCACPSASSKDMAAVLRGRAGEEP